MSQQRERSRDHQRQKRDGIQPDDVPVIAHDEGAQGVKNTESGDRDIGALEGDLQKQRVEKSSESDFHTGDDIEKLSQALGGNENGEEVQGAGEIVGHQSDIVSAAAAFPGPEQRASVLELVQSPP